MELNKHKEYQTVRLFAILAAMTAIVVLLFKVVLFAPQNPEASRIPAQSLQSIEANQSPLLPKQALDKK